MGKLVSCREGLEYYAEYRSISNYTVAIEINFKCLEPSITSHL